MRKSYSCLAAHLFVVSLSHAATVDPRSLILTKTDSTKVSHGEAWDGTRTENRIRFAVDEPYTYCRHYVIENSRNPRERPPADDYSGYRMVGAAKKYIEWQWWVMPWRRFKGRGHWLDADFSVVWILGDATQDELQHQGCRTLPVAAEVRTWPDNSHEDPPAGPSTIFNFMAIHRQYCQTKNGAPTGGYVDIAGLSKNSCSDAKNEVVKELKNFPDQCEKKNAGERFSGRSEWLSTLKCP